jgi:RNA polymerase sigma-70 factor (ECF subfamily)
VDDREADARIDAALVDEALRDGGTRAFSVLVRRHQGALRAQLRRLLRDDPATADDLAQEAFVLAWRKLDQFRGDSRFSTWLHRIAHTCFLQHHRRVGGHIAQELDTDDDETPGAAAEPLAPELGLDLDAAMRRLSEKQRSALLYCVQLGLSHEEAAEILDMPLGSVKTHVARGKLKLRELLRAWSPDSQRSPSHD